MVQRIMIALILLGASCKKSREEQMFSSDKTDIARLTVKKYADEAYPSWAMSNTSKSCPDRLEDLNEFMNSKDVRDPWGNNYGLVCGANAPAGVKGIGVSSNGPDGKPGTADDIHSWE